MSTTCSYRKTPGSPQCCLALPDPRSRRGLCAGHRAEERRGVAIAWRQRIERGGRATADAWARHEGWDPAELETVPVPAPGTEKGRPSRRARGAA